ncbi:MAG: hypothetical protein CMO01_23455 [Thalassobius sp.]|nr:hypothetical protein [Thalassovita sp.]
MKMQATLKANLVSFRKVEFDTEVQEEIIAWGKGIITKGPDGGVRIPDGTATVYVPSGFIIIRNDHGFYEQLSEEQFLLNYTIF